MGNTAVVPFQALSLGTKEGIPDFSIDSGDQPQPSNISAQIRLLGLRARPADGEHNPSSGPD